MFYGSAGSSISECMSMIETGRHCQAVEGPYGEGWAALCITVRAFAILQKYKESHIVDRLTLCILNWVVEDRL